MKSSGADGGDVRPGRGESDPAAPGGPLVADGCGGGVRVAPVVVSGLSDAGLRARLGEIGRARSVLAALNAEALCEIARRADAAAAEQAAKEVLSVSGRAARSEVKNSVALGELDRTRSGLSSGAIPEGHAMLIARAAGEAPHR